MTSSSHIVPAECRLEELRPFCVMSESGRSRFVRLASWHRYEADETLREGHQEADDVVFVVGGKVKVSTRRTDDCELILGIFGPGHPSGGFGLFGDTYPGRIEALTDVDTAEIPQDDLLAILDDEPRALPTFFEMATERNRHLVRRLHDATVSPAERRLALVFEMFRDHWGEPIALDDGEQGVYVPFSIRRRDLAALINTRTETAIRIVREWERADLVRTESDGFVILDPDEIADLASK